VSLIQIQIVPINQPTLICPVAIDLAAVRAKISKDLNLTMQLD
jgi:hypothetical protein